MITEIKKTFFDKFGIEPKNNKCELVYCAKNLSYNCSNCEHFKPKYPQITDRHYLELICVLNKLIDEKYGEYKTFISFDYKNLKEEILEECLLHREELKHQVQAIFKGEK